MQDPVPPLSGAVQIGYNGPWLSAKVTVPVGVPGPDAGATVAEKVTVPLVLTVGFTDAVVTEAGFGLTVSVVVPEEAA